MGCSISSLFTNGCPQKTTEWRILMLAWVTRNVHDRDYTYGGTTHVYNTVEREEYEIESDLQHLGNGLQLSAFARYEPWQSKVELLGKVDEYLRGRPE